MEDKIKKVAIIGTGPTGAISAKYLIENSSFKIDLIDAGLTSKTFIKPEKTGLIPKKTLFGNAFIYKRRDSIELCFDKHTSFDTSHALGGLSNVWGANISSLHEYYYKKWSLDKKKAFSAFHYVLKNIPITARRDMIDEQFDLSISNKHHINKGLSYDHCELDNFKRKFLSRLGLSIGLSKLAIDFNKCIKCSGCMAGCPEGAIFNSADIIANLTLNLKFKYKPNIIVNKFEEKSDFVSLEVKNINTGKIEILNYDYVIIASGTIDSTNIVRKSLGLKSTFKIKESKKYYMPFFSTKFLSGSNLDETISLSHIFIQHFQNKSLVHCQLYTCYHLIDYIFRDRFGSFASILIPFKFILKHFYIAMIYLDSEDSGYINIKYSKDKIQIQGVESLRSKIRLKIFISQLRKAYSAVKLIPIPFVLASKLGHSQHFGATIPMRRHPGKNEVDLYGRPFAHKKTFIVDTSILPTIPASPTTIVVMSNAIRICAELIKRDKDSFA